MTARSRLVFLLAPLALAAGCVDAPITDAQLEADGRLAAGSAQQLFVEATSAQAPTQVAQPLQLTAVLAGEATGALQDRTIYRLGEDERVHLHLRADGIDDTRPVKFVWTHETRADGTLALDEAGTPLAPVESMGFLSPSETIDLAASRPVQAADLGGWEVEVRGVGPFGATLYERHFEIVDPEAADS